MLPPEGGSLFTRAGRKIADQVALDGVTVANKVKELRTLTATLKDGIEQGADEIRILIKSKTDLLQDSIDKIRSICLPAGQGVKCLKLVDSLGNEILTP